jgi:hypothetical protein
MLLIRCALIAALLLLPTTLPAAESDLQSWTLLTAQGHVAERVRLYAEVQPRLSLLPELGLDRLLLRGAAGYDLTPSVTLWLGYAFTPLFQPVFESEQRPFQQLTVNTTFDAGLLVNRTRFEQRFIEGKDLSIRLRHMVRFVRPVAAGSSWDLAAYDELFVNLNAPDVGPAQGFDQNRLFLGLARRFVGGLAFEFGYLLDAVARPEPKPLLLRHCVVTWLAWNWP